MELFFELVGKKAQQWTLNKSEVKIGRDAACDVRFSGEEFPMVSRFHVSVRSDGAGYVVEDMNSPNGTLLNGSRVQRSKIFPGDTLRLGADGPELRVRFVPPAEKGPFIPPTIVVSNPDAILQSASPPPAAPASATATTSSYAHAEAAMLERRLDSMRRLLSLTLAAVVLLAILVTYQSYLILRNQDTLLQMRRQATDAVGQFAPAMDQRMAELRQRADQMDQAVAGIDAKIKKAEDQFMHRIETEMPVTIDRYIQRKLEDIRKNNRP